MRKFWKRREDALERVLRAERHEASDELVSRLVGRVESAHAPRRWSRVAFAGALSVFMLGSFASFGGLGYAAEGAQGAASAVTRIVKTEKAQVRASTQSAARTQYGKQTFTPPAAPKTIKVAGISTPTSSESSDELPFTGLGLAATAAFGLLLLGAGVLLRRRESHTT